MNYSHPDIVVRYIHTKNKIRKIVSYRSNTSALRVNHEKINAYINKKFIPSIFSKAYVKNRSIYDNAAAHLYNDCFVMMDIKRFFQNICHKQLIEKLYHELNLHKEHEISKISCAKIVEYCSIGSRGIPLGFVTSPVLSNIYLKDFDGIFYGKLKSLQLENLIYTRYADDLTVSFKDNDQINREQIKAVIMELASMILKRYGLCLNPTKTKFVCLNKSNHVRITGISISTDKNGRRQLTVGRKTKNQLYRDALAALENGDRDLAFKVKGLQSFILSVEKNGYEHVYSSQMMEKVREWGYPTLKELIDAL